jgi:hypothetical protein
LHGKAGLAGLFLFALPFLFAPLFVCVPAKLLPAAAIARALQQTLPTNR